MKISFTSSCKRFNFPFRVIGNAGRYDTISDCEFLDDTHIICADRQMAKLYLINFDISSNKHTILDSIECICNNKQQNIELIYIHNKNTIYAVSYTSYLFSCEIVNNKFCNLKIVLINVKEAYHGLCRSENDSLYLTNTLKSNLTEFNLITGLKKKFICNGAVKIKDVCIIDDNHLLTISSDWGPVTGIFDSNGKLLTKNRPYDSHLLIYNRITSNLVNKYTLPNTQIDSCVYNNTFCFVTCTNLDGSGFIFRSKIDSNYNFTDVVHIPCASFPHGVSIYNNLIGYTSYGEAALYIFEIDENGNLVNINS